MRYFTNLHLLNNNYATFFAFILDVGYSGVNNAEGRIKLTSSIVIRPTIFELHRICLSATYTKNKTHGRFSNTVFGKLEFFSVGFYAVNQEWLSSC